MAGNADAKRMPEARDGDLKADGAEPELKDLRERFRMPHYKRAEGSVRNVNEVQDQELSRLDKFAVAITDKIGSMGFFLLIFTWTVLWCGYNIVASDVKSLHWRAFDPFPAFVAYLLISNVIQIWLMPLIMVGQNMQARHSEIRAETDFEINKIAEQEVTLILQHMERNTDLLLQLMRHQQCQISELEEREILAEREIAEKLVAIDPSKSKAPAAV